MLFFINPDHRKIRPAKKAAKRSKAKRVAKRKKRSIGAVPSLASVPARSRKLKRSSVARKRVRRARKASVTKMATGRRRRVRAAVTHRNPAPKRRRHRRYKANPAVTTFRKNPKRRRRFRRNPGLLPGGTKGIVGNIVQGLKDGVAIVGGQVAARKIRGAVTGMLPAATQLEVASGMGYVALSLVSAIAVSIAAKKFIPGQARMIAGGAFSEAINAGIAQTPVAPYLGAFAPVRRIVPPITRRAGGRPGVNAWPGGGNPALSAARNGLAAWPMMRAVGTTAGA